MTTAYRDFSTLTQSDKDEMKRMYENWYTATEVAKKFRLSVNVVWRLLKRSGAKMRPCGRAANAKPVTQLDNNPKHILRVEGDTVHCINPYNTDVRFMVSKEDLGLVSKYVWNRSRSSMYIKRNVGRSKRELYLHTAIMTPKKGQVVDFVNGDIYDLRRCNLRLCKRSNDAKNRALYKTNTSGYKGVSWSARVNRYVARIQSDGKQIHLGYFRLREDAARAYNDAAVKYHKEFARLNIINDSEAA